MSAPYQRDTREVIVERSTRNNSMAMIVAIALVAIVAVELAIVLLGQPSGSTKPAGGGGTTTSQPTDAGSPRTAPSQAAPTNAPVPSAS